MIIRLAHAELAVDDLGAARAFYVDVLGFTVAIEEGPHLYLRGSDEWDVWSLALTAGERPGLLHLGFRVESPQALEQIRALHNRLGLPVEERRRGSEPHQGPALRTRTPDGHPVEFFHELSERETQTGTEAVRLPMRTTHQQHGLPPVQLDHVNLRVTDPDTALGYWRDQLGFSVSERFEGPDGSTEIAWTRRRRQSHEIALGRFPRAGFHHVAYTVGDSAKIVHVADVVADAGFYEQIEFGPVRHGVSNALAIYVRDPAGNRLEFFAGHAFDRDLDRPPVTWPHETYWRQGLVWWGAKPPASFASEVGEIVAAAPPRSEPGVTVPQR
jgi:catechol 2,3-dioxygenase